MVECIKPIGGMHIPAIPNPIAAKKERYDNIIFALSERFVNKAFIENNNVCLQYYLFLK